MSLADRFRAFVSAYEVDDGEYGGNMESAHLLKRDRDLFRDVTNALELLTNQTVTPAAVLIAAGEAAAAHGPKCPTCGRGSIAGNRFGEMWCVRCRALFVPAPVAPTKDAAPSSMGPRRCDIERNTITERAIRSAMALVEQLPADPLHTDAVVLLQQALDRIADYVDGVPRVDTATLPARVEMRCVCGRTHSLSAGTVVFCPCREVLRLRPADCDCVPDPVTGEHNSKCLSNGGPTS
jgi:hypothetical protein